MGDMLDVHALKPGDLDRLAPSEKDALLLQMLSHIGRQSKALQVHQEQIEQRDKALKFKDAKIEKITFELQRLKRWQFSAHSERMTAEQRQLFEDTLVEDRESLQAELDALLGDKPDTKKEKALMVVDYLAPKQKPPAKPVPPRSSKSGCRWTP